MACALALAACSDPSSDPAGGPLARRVQHLDPRLEDGRPVADVLATERTVKQVFTLSDPASVEADLEGWSLVNAKTMEPPRKRSGVHFRGAEYDPARSLTTVGLRYTGGIDAAEVNVIEVDMRAYSPGSAAVRWNLPRDAKAPPKGVRRVELALSETREIQTVRFLVGVNRNWFGRVPSLEITPMSRGGQAFDVAEIRFVSEGYCFGSEPLPRTGPEASGDGGLVGFEKRLSRVWPGDLEVPMFARATVPAGGHVTTRIGLPAAMHQVSDQLSFAIDARPAAGGVWTEVAATAFVPDEQDFDEVWHPLDGSLAAWVGQEVELRLRAWRDGDERPRDATPGATADSPKTSRVWWAEPMVIGTPSPDRRPDVILVTLDTTRTDAVGCYGGPRRTPNLDRLAEEGWLFENAWSGCNSTLPSHTSILTGLEVPVHGVLDNRSMLGPDLRTLAQHLRAAGYTTGAAVSVEHLQSGYSGLGRGFDRFIDVQPGSVVNGAFTLDSVHEWIEEWRELGPHPLFLWVHLFDPHTPYGPPREFMSEYEDQYGVEAPPRQIELGGIGPTDYTKRGKFLDGVNNPEYARYLYEAGVAYSDKLFGELRESVESMGQGDQTLWIVTSDHGEALGELDVWYNHAMLSKSVMNVPWIVRLPGTEGGRRIPERVSTVELAGSLARYLGLDPLGTGVTGTGEKGLFDGGAPPADRRIWFSHSHKDQIGFRDSEVHFFENMNRPYGHLGKDRVQPLGKRYLYDASDNGECETNLADERIEAAERYSNEVHKWTEVMSTGVTIKKELTAEDNARLEALGYGGEGESDG